MADINKSIQINVEADLKQLLNNLQKMPNMTKKEAQKMVKELSSELKKAEAAAKKTALVSEKSFKEISKSADKAAKSTSNLKRQSRELGGAMSATGDLVGELDPALGSAVITIQMAGMAVRDLGKALLTGNPIILGVVAVIAGLTAAYYALTAGQREAERQQKLVEEATKQTNERLSEQADIIRTLNKSQVKSTRELLVLTGQITQLEADIADAKDEAKRAIEADLITQNKYITEQRNLLSIVKRFRNNRHAVTEEEKKTLEMAMLSSKERKFNQGLLENETALMGQLFRFEEKVNSQLKEQVKLSLGIEASHNKTLANTISILEFKDETRQEEERLAKIEKKRAEDAAKAAKEEARRAKEKAEKDREEAERLALNSKLEDSVSKERLKATTLDNQNRAARIALIDDEIERGLATLDLDKDILDQKISQIELQKEANLALAQTEEQIGIAKAANLELDNQILEMKEGLAIKEEALAKQRKKSLEDEAKQNKLTGAEVAGFYIQAAKATSELIKTATNENKDAALIAFRVAQAAAIAEIAINTAKNIVEVGTNPFAIAAVSALGVAQAATVALQKPPEFHMGGMIGKGEDTTQITALRGEAVLDRRTVSRLGGERGVDALQRGENPISNQVIVIQPFKHFDRFIRSNQKRGGIMSKLNKVKSAGAY